MRKNDYQTGIEQNIRTLITYQSLSRHISIYITNLSMLILHVLWRRTLSTFVTSFYCFEKETPQSYAIDLTIAVTVIWNYINQVLISPITTFNEDQVHTLLGYVFRSRLVPVRGRCINSRIMMFVHSRVI